MTKAEKRALGETRLVALREKHGRVVELQMVMGLTSGMLQHMRPDLLDAKTLLQFVGAMTDDDWAEGVKRTADVVQWNDENRAS